MRPGIWQWAAPWRTPGPIRRRNSSGAARLHKDKLSKTTRYYASKKGGTLFKINNETQGKTGVLIGQHVTLFNKYYELPFEEYNIDYNFYINECNKIIDKIEIKEEQLSLF